jgi:hypothetical protein
VKEKERPIVVLLGLFGSPLLAVWMSYVLTILWGWFMVPLGVHAIGKAHAYGLATLIGLVRTKTGKSDDASVAAAIAIAIIAPTISLLAGWIAHSLMGGG